MFQKTSRITFELSNLCNMHHEKCPAAHINHPIILSEKIVYHVLDTCYNYHYKGIIAFHRYNEPGIDPRLMLFIDKARYACGHIFLMTNGFYFTELLEREFYAHGVSEILISNHTLPLDDRMTMMDGPDANCKKSCYAPLSDLNITCEGTVGLCCYDYLNTCQFGNLKEQKLTQILFSDKIKKTYARLSSGDRFLNICKKCAAVR